ncbi:termination factor Rho [Saccharophagus sp. K07]|nr:Rho termination factor N-terminal domain-containing protein [Saccharophagus sp. K07]MBC6905422.1 termination factor Rho [Saccharophagus sp. K07]
MAQGSKAKYTEKQKHKAEHIEESYEKKGVSAKKAEQIAWATVNKQSGGGERSGSGTKKSAKAKANDRHDSAQKAAETRKKAKKQGSLEKQTRESLLEIARAHHIPGRSHMKKQDLIAALRSPRA